MVKKKSKRLTLKKKYKIKRKVKEHEKKLKRAAKKNPFSSSKLRKDPGIPNLWPFKQDILEKMQQNKEKLKEEKENKKKKRKEKMEDEDGDDDVDSASQSKSTVSEMAKLQFDAMQSASEYERKQSLLGDDNEEDGTRDLKQNALSKATKRTYYREFKKVVETSDVIIEVLDARDPMGCRCPDIEKNILSQNPNKKIVLLLNKIDLVPREVVQQWVQFLRKEFPTIAFKSNTQKQKQNKSQTHSNALHADRTTMNSSICLGANSLLQLLKNYARSADIKKNITVGIIGYPNVGKSSVINSLKRSKVVNVGAMPGLTKNMQEIHLDQNIKLLDCPGIIFSHNAQLDAEIILRNAVRIEQLDDVISPVEQILRRCKKERLMKRYNVGDFSDAEQFLTLVAKQRGMMEKGGKPKITQAGQVILKDWTSGKIPFFTVPPSDTINPSQQATSSSNHDQWSGMMMVDQSSDLAQISSINGKEDFIPMTSSSIPLSSITVEKDNEMEHDDYDYEKDLVDDDENDDDDDEFEEDDEDDDDE